MLLDPQTNYSRYPLPYLVPSAALTSAANAATLALAVAHSELTYLPYFLCYDVSQSVDLGRSNNPNTTPTKDYEMCEWWFTSTVSREDVLRRGRGDLHQGDADRDAGYSWGTGAIEDEGDRCLDSSYSLGSVKAGIG